MTEQLIDLLSMTRGLRVSGTGATAHFHEQRDPREVYRALGVDTVIDGTIVRRGPRLRASIRMLDAGDRRVATGPRMRNRGPRPSCVAFRSCCTSRCR